MAREVNIEVLRLHKIKQIINNKKRYTYGKGS